VFTMLFGLDTWIFRGRIEILALNSIF